MSPVHELDGCPRHEEKNVHSSLPSFVAAKQIGEPKMAAVYLRGARWWFPLVAVMVLESRLSTRLLVRPVSSL
jgi:hypothetical protein